LLHNAALLEKLDILARDSSGLSSVSGDESTTLKKGSSPELAVGQAPRGTNTKLSLPAPPETISKPKLKPLDIKPSFKVEKDVKPSISDQQKAASKDKGKGKIKARVIQELELSENEDKKPAASSSKPKPPPATFAPKKQSTFKPLIPKPKVSTSSAQDDHITHYLSDSDSSSVEVVLQPSTSKTQPSTAPAPKTMVSVVDPAAKVKGQLGARKGSTRKGKGKRPPSSSDDEIEEEDPKPVVKSAPKEKKVKRELTPPSLGSPTSPKSSQTLNSTSTPITEPQSLSITPKPKSKPQPKKRPHSPTDEDRPRSIASLPSFKIHKTVKKDPEEEQDVIKSRAEGEEGEVKTGSSAEKGTKVDGVEKIKEEEGRDVDEFAAMKTEH